MPVPALLIEAGIAAVGKLTSAIADSVAFYDDAQKASLSLGMTYGDASKRLEGSMNGLRGSLETKLAGGFELLDAGFQGNMKGMSLLMNQQKVLGGNSKKTAATMASLKGALGLNNDELNSLSVDLLATANKYGVSTDKLVKGLDGLAKSFPVMAAAGVNSAAVTDAITELNSRTGGMMEDQITNAIAQALDPTAEALIKSIAGGTKEYIDIIADENSTSDQIVEAVLGMQTQIAKRAQGHQMPGSLYGEVGVPEMIYGPMATTARQFVSSWEENAKRATSLSPVDYGSAASTQLSEILNPFKGMASDIASNMTGRTSVDPTYVKLVGNTQPDSLGKTSLLNDANSNNINGVVSNSNQILTKLYGATLDANHQRGAAAEDNKFERTVTAIENLGNGE
jgi:hypothetical protein